MRTTNPKSIIPSKLPLPEPNPWTGMLVKLI